MVEEKGPDFVIKDKRRFDSAGEAKSEEAEPQEAPRAEAAPREDGTTQDGKAQYDKAEGGPPLPEMNFATLIFSLSSSALVHLGQMPDPATGEARADLPLAKQTIDLLGLLQTKTKGNLEEDEEKMLEGVLYDLRMAYVQAVKNAPKSGS